MWELLFLFEVQLGYFPETDQQSFFREYDLFSQLWIFHENGEAQVEKRD